MLLGLNHRGMAYMHSPSRPIEGIRMRRVLYRKRGVLIGHCPVQPNKLERKVVECRSLVMKGVTDDDGPVDHWRSGKLDSLNGVARLGATV